MENEILRLLGKYKGLKVISGPNYRKERKAVNGDAAAASGNEYYECTLEYKRKIFSVTFVQSENPKDTLLEYLKQNNIAL